MLCATPRTGSSLLCSLLASTGVAGRPESYFREPDQHTWAGRFGVPVAADGDFDYADFVGGALRFGSTANGVFAARVMWGTMHLLLDGLDRRRTARGDLEVLEDAFGPLRFVHLTRRDVVAQAVSWARAEQSGYWQPGDEARAEVRFDFNLIDSLVSTIHEHNAAWRTWFSSAAVTPLDVSYEALGSDPAGTVSNILTFIGAEPPRGWTPTSPHERQADALNADWIQRYRGIRLGRDE